MKASTLRKVDQLKVCIMLMMFVAFDNFFKGRDFKKLLTFQFFLTRKRSIGIFHYYILISVLYEVRSDFIPGSVCSNYSQNSVFITHLLSLLFTKGLLGDSFLLLKIGFVSVI